MTLRDIIADEIRARGPIPFSRYMEMCLYYPELGYYSRQREQFGKAGDFYTASDVHAIFGRLFARQFDEMWAAMGLPPRMELIEIGPGRGLFIQDVMDWSKRKFPDFISSAHLTLVESSSALRRRLEERFVDCIQREHLRVASDIGAALGHEHSIDNVIVFANELFDAFPVEVVTTEGQVYVDVREGRFVEAFRLPSAHVDELLDRYGVRPEPGERAEVPLAGTAYIQEIASRIGCGFLIFVDYGYTREELLAGRYRAGTVMTYRRHTTSPDPYEAPGEQDITAHVNFSALRDIALSSGMDGGFILTQSQFLMGIGEQNQFADAFEDAQLPQEQTKRALQLKHLVTPAGMGEVFQVLILQKGIPREKFAQLSGMKFARRI
jgi:SAM-dependent MidA family methyltransferase